MRVPFAVYDNFYIMPWNEASGIPMHRCTDAPATEVAEINIEHASAER